MSELYDPKFTRKKFGNYNKDKNFVSVTAGTDSFFLEDEFNEMQWIQNEARADLFRARYHSGIFKKNDVNGVLCDDTTLRPNFIAVNNFTALINGYLIEIEGHNGYLNDSDVIKRLDVNNIFLPASPEEGYREDLVYIEMWFSELKYIDQIWNGGNINNFKGMIANDLFDSRINGETCRRMQMQWAIRVAPGVAQSGVGFDDTLLAHNTPAKGGNTVFSDYGFWRADYALDGSFKSSDKGLWVAGQGIPGEMNTLDGYSYAIPLFKIRRRNSAEYLDHNRNGGAIFTPDSENISDRPDGKFSNIIYEDDIIDLRNMVNMSNTDYSRILEKNFCKLMTGQLSGISKPTMMTAYFGVNPIVPSSDTKIYLSCNKDMSYNGITPSVSVPYSFVPGAEQEAVRIDGYNSGFSYSVNQPFTTGLVQMIVKLIDYSDKDLWSMRNEEKEVLSCSIRDGKIIIEDLTHPEMIAVDLYDPDIPELREYAHVAVTWSKTTQMLYLVLNGKVVSTINCSVLMTAGTFKTFILGWSDKELGSQSTIFDEVEVSSRFSTSFSQLPIDFIAGDAKIITDMQKGRRNYSLVSSKTTITSHISVKADSLGIVNFSIRSLVGSTFTDMIPSIYFDNEAVVVSSAVWSGLGTDTLTCSATGLGADVTYNFVIISEMLFEGGQGFNALPQKMYKAIGEKTQVPFIPVRSDKVFEEHFIDNAIQITDSVGNTRDRLRAYKPGVSALCGFGIAIKCYVKANGTAIITLPLTVYNREVTTVYDVNVENDPYRSNLISDFTIIGDNVTVTLNQAIEAGTSLEVILGTTSPVLVYNYTAGGIENLAKVEKATFTGDGVSCEFIYRSESKILSSMSSILGGQKKFIALVNSKIAMLEARIVDTFILFNFIVPPANKAVIEIYLVSEYDPMRSERLRAWFEILEYQGTQDMTYAASFDRTTIMCHLGSIFVTTDGINIPVETRLNKNIVNTAYLPVVGPIDAYLVPTKIAGNSTNMKARIDYAEMNSNEFNDPLVILNELRLKLKQQQSGRGYFGYATVDDKSFFSVTKLPQALPHLGVLPMLVKDKNDIVKMAVMTTYTEDDLIRISGNQNETAIDIFDLDENILVK